jgi:hypothetical protein
MSLGDWIRVVRTFVGGFAQESGGLIVEPGKGPTSADPDGDRIDILALIRDLKVPFSFVSFAILVIHHVALVVPKHRHIRTIWSNWASRMIESGGWYLV